MSFSSWSLPLGAMVWQCEGGAAVWSVRCDVWHVTSDGGGGLFDTALYSTATTSQRCKLALTPLVTPKIRPLILEVVLGWRRPTTPRWFRWANELHNYWWTYLLMLYYYLLRSTWAICEWLVRSWYMLVRVVRLRSLTSGDGGDRVGVRWRVIHMLGWGDGSSSSGREVSCLKC